MVTPIDAVRFHSDFSETVYWPRAEERYPASEHERENLAPARGALLGLVLGGLMWVGIIAAARAMLGL